ALSDVIDWRQFGSSATGEAVSDERFTLVPRFPIARLDGAAFYGALPVRLAGEIRAFRPDVMIVQGAEDTALALLARRLARVSVPVVFDVHGDWRNNTRVYGSRGRRLISPVADGLARHTLRHADAVRTVSAFTSELVWEAGVEPIATFPAYMDLGPYLATPPASFPERPVALFVGVLERYKAVDVLAEAWQRVIADRPGMGLHIVGAGRLESLVRSLVADPTLGARWTERLGTAGVARALDEATLLVLPSRREGMGRVIVEAFCRGRPVVGTRSGGIPDLVEDGVSGVLVPTDDPASLAEALGRVLGDRSLAERLGDGAHAASATWAATPEEFARRVRDLVDAVIARRGS
ncbi:glycosyltransferase family 4 protein, partial [Gaiella sp.]|uniref:glycosyltransferase family 4 protein n=1 Tax=Gaiella sp. TaxID=2663207 RepID=UPI003264EE39